MANDIALVTSIKADTPNFYKNVKTQTSQLYAQYEKLVHKKWQELAHSLKHHKSLNNIKTEFYGDSYLSFIDAIEAVDLNKIVNNNWKFIGYYSWYLSNLVNKYRRDYISQCENETVFYTQVKDSLVVSPAVAAVSSSEDVEALSIDTIVSETISDFLAHKWTEEEKKVFLLKAKGYTNEKITEETGISYFKIKKHLAKMREDLRDIY